jgi:glycosyltransferase involved in cell wall biosynthesis
MSIRVKYTIESKQGLSYARNCGAEFAESNWLLYIDDDSKASPDFINRALFIIRNFDFDCFGGIYTGWFRYGRPRWMAEDFGSKKPLLTSIGRIKSAELDGGIFAIKKEVLLKVGGFPAHLGMTGNKIAYGEETALQQLLLKNQYILGFDPLLKIEHLVGKHKLSIWWHLRSEYAKGRDFMIIAESEKAQWQLYYQIKFIIAQLYIGLKKNLMKIFKPGYYIENLLLDITGPIFYRFGQQSRNYKT